MYNRQHLFFYLCIAHVCVCQQLVAVLKEHWLKEQGQSTLALVGENTSLQEYQRLFAELDAIYLSQVWDELEKIRDKS